jgi:hypothetical protein
MTPYHLVRATSSAGFQLEAARCAGRAEPPALGAIVMFWPRLPSQVRRFGHILPGHRSGTTDDTEAPTSVIKAMTSTLPDTVTFSSSPFADHKQRQSYPCITSTTRSYSVGNPRRA